MRRITALACAIALFLLAACGGGGGGSSSTPSNNSQPNTPPPSTGTSSNTPDATPGANVLPVSVEGGPWNSVNTAFASITLCAPGGTSCQTIDHILIDTGSSGLRVFASALSSSLAQALRQQSGTTAECMQFIDGYTWGPLRQAALRAGGKSLDNLTIQVMADGSFATVPTQCVATGSSINTPSVFGANGVLGVGLFLQDCGPTCVQRPSNGVYYNCGSSCQQVAMPLAQQVQNPVSLFAADNNGVAIVLPAVPANGTASVSGSLIFGIGTQANNIANAGTVLTTDANTGYITTIYKGRTMQSSFIDSGSNGIFFSDTSISSCSNGFYCPTTTQNLSAVNQGTNGVTNTVGFRVANATTLFSNTSATAFDALAGGNPNRGSFDWGLPFFFGRTVFTAIEGRTTPQGTGPYFAY